MFKHLQIEKLQRTGEIKTDLSLLAEDRFNSTKVTTVLYMKT